MVQFFREGGLAMVPILVLALINLWVAIRFAFDVEPIRLRFFVAVTAALLVNVALAVVVNLAMVMRYVAAFYAQDADRAFRHILVGLKESSRPAILGLGLLSLAVILVAVGVYRGTRRELAAAKG